MTLASSLRYFSRSALFLIMSMPSLLKLCACFFLILTGCATVPSDEATLWRSASIHDEDRPVTQVIFLGGQSPVIARQDSAYRSYRVIPRSQYEKYHVPTEAKTAFSGRDHVNYDVVYAVETSAKWTIYGYTFGLYDIDFPPKVLGTIPKK